MTVIKNKEPCCQRQAQAAAELGKENWRLQGGKLGKYAEECSTLKTQEEEYLKCLDKSLAVSASGYQVTLSSRRSKGAQQEEAGLLIQIQFI